MKKVSALFCLFIGLAVGAHAQNCYTGPNHITPIASSNPGFVPTTENLPCAVTGVQLSDTLYFTNYSNFSGITLDSLTIDSIGNLPDGTCWSTNKATNSFAGGESGVVYIHGLNTAAPGQYSLSIYITGYLAGGITIGPDANAEQLTGLYYWIRVKCPGTACTALDTVNGKTQAFIPYAACSSAPVATISPAGQTSFCPDSFVTLTAGGGPGWTFKWSNAAHSTSQSISVNSPGSYTVTVYNGADSAVSSPTIAVSATSPTVSINVSGPVTFCQGGSVNLTASANNQYNWSTNSSAQMITATQTGTYTVTVTNAGGCTASVSQAVTVNPAPNLFINTANSTICAGQSDSLIASGADIYSWSTGATTAGINVAPTANNNNYSVTGTNSQDGCTATQSVSIGVQSYPAAQAIVGSISVTPLQSYSYLVTATSGITYAWSVQNGAIQSGQGTNTVNVIWGATGPYSITLIQSNGCADTTSLSIVATGIADLSDNNKWSVYPNPAHDYVTIHNGDMHDATVYTVQVVNTLGQIVHTQEMSKNDTQLNMSGCGTSGVYFLYISSNGQNQVAVKKIVLQ